MHISTSVGALMTLLLGIGAFALFGSFRMLLGQRVPGAPELRHLLLGGVAAGTLALGCRVCVAEGLVSWCPFLDQWHAEISGVAVPLAHGKLAVGDLVAGNNEHRVILTRAVALGVMLVDGSWDNRVLVVVNYLLESFAVAWVCVLAWGSFGWVRGSFVGAAAFLPMLLVCDWETIVSSNQMQFVFMAVGSVIGLSLTHDYSLRSLGSWSALAICALMLGSMASGLLTALSMAATGLVVAYAGGRGVRAVAGFCVACLALAAAGWLTKVDFTALYPIYAKSAAGWLEACIVYSAWPLPPNLLGFLGLWTPWGVLLGATLWRRRLEPLAAFGIGLGIWGLLQSCALAWARAGFVGLVSSRYTEFLGWGFVANAVSLAVLCQNTGWKRAGRSALWGVVALWTAAVGGSEIWRSAVIFQPYTESFRIQSREEEQRLGTYMRTGDARVIQSVTFPHIPYVAEEILPVLRDPVTRPLLPAPLRRDFVRDRHPELLTSVQEGPLGFLALRVLSHGPQLVGFGLSLLVGAFLLSRRSVTPARAGTLPAPKETGPASVLPRRPGRSRA